MARALLTSLLTAEEPLCISYSSGGGLFVYCNPNPSAFMPLLNLLEHLKN
jgi:hypothetical protein